jgi:hypothetical protein
MRISSELISSAALPSKHGDNLFQAWRERARWCTGELQALAAGKTLFMLSSIQGCIDNNHICIKISFYFMSLITSETKIILSLLEPIKPLLVQAEA